MKIKSKQYTKVKLTMDMDEFFRLISILGKYPLYNVSQEEKETIMKLYGKLSDEKDRLFNDMHGG